MENTDKEQAKSETTGVDVRSVVRGAIQEFLSMEQAKAEPAYKAELVEERRRREQLEQRVNHLVEENRRNKMMAEELERGASIRNELQRLGVSKVDLAFRAVKDDIIRTDDGRLMARGSQGDVTAKEYLAQFVGENPELLPARIVGGSGAGSAGQRQTASGSLDLDKLKPGMNAEDLERMRQEIARVAQQSLRGQ